MTAPNPHCRIRAVRLRESGLVVHFPKRRPSDDDALHDVLAANLRSAVSGAIANLRPIAGWALVVWEAEAKHTWAEYANAGRTHIHSSQLPGFVQDVLRRRQIDRDISEHLNEGA